MTNVGKGMKIVGKGIFYLLVFCQSMFMMTNLQRLKHARQATVHVQTEETLKSKTPNKS